MTYVFYGELARLKSFSFKSHMLPIHNSIRSQTNANTDMSKVPVGVKIREVARVNMDASDVIPPTTARIKPAFISVIATESPNIARISVIHKTNTNSSIIEIIIELLKAQVRTFVFKTNLSYISCLIYLAISVSNKILNVAFFN